MRTVAIIGLTVAGMLVPAMARAQDVYSAPPAAQLRESVEAWLKARGLAGTPAAEATRPLWEFRTPPTPEERFSALLRTYYLADEDVRNLVDKCRQDSGRPGFWKASLPASVDDSDPVFATSMRYFLARHFVLLGAYNEALDLFRQIDPRYAADPAAVLFHRAVCEHHLLDKEPGLATLKKLLSQTENVPERYRKIGELMRQDLEDLESKSLGEVARQMKDVERRLSLSRADDGVQEVERKIVETLDELIKKMEEQRNNAQSKSSGSGGAAPPTNPAEDKYLGGMQGRGETDKRDLGHQDNWGNLPPKAKEAAKNMLETEFPAHYRAAVEEYLKKLAERPAP